MSQIDDQIIDQIRERTKDGIKTYGSTVDRTDRNPAFWRVHLQEELIDALKYNQRCINDEAATIKDFIKENIEQLLTMKTYPPVEFKMAIDFHVHWLETRLKELEGES